MGAPAGERYLLLADISVEWLEVARSSAAPEGGRVCNDRYGGVQGPISGLREMGSRGEAHA